MSQRTYEAPGPGTWEQDPTHMPRPMTRYFGEVFAEPFMNGFKEGSRRYGLLFSHLQPALVNGFLYNKLINVDPDDGPEVEHRFKAATEALESKLCDRTWISGIESSSRTRSSGTEPSRVSLWPTWTPMASRRTWRRFVTTP